MMKRNKWQIFVGWILPILLVLILLIFVIPFPVNRTIQALEINMADESHVVERTVTLNGHYHINLFTGDTFSGSMTVSGYDYADGSYPMKDLQIGRDSPIIYEIEPKDPALLHGMHLFGQLSSRSFFSDMLIAVFEHRTAYDGSFSQTDGTVIVANATDRESALEIAEDWLHEGE